jgi:hypothetical protein
MSFFLRLHGGWSRVGVRLRVVRFLIFEIGGLRTISGCSVKQPELIRILEGTTNPIESTFATVRLRTAKTRGMLTRDTMLTMVFKISLSAQKRWRRLNRPERLGELISGIKFVDGIKQEKEAA